MSVVIDGQAIGHVHANECRYGANPVPAGMYCADDVSNIFGNLTPQPPTTERTSNPTKFRNLDAGRAAIGWYTFDSTALANGVHTIAWGVTDSASRADGLGSRYFTVSNGSANAQVLADAPAMALGAEGSLSTLPLDDGSVWGRTTFDMKKPWDVVAPALDGDRHVRIPGMGRVELYLGEGTDAGFLAANGTLRQLPPGSQLSNGVFTWAPGPGYIGEYRLIFVRQGKRVTVAVTIRDPIDRNDIEAAIDDAGPDAGARGTVRLTGWAADRSAWTGTGLGTVQVWAQRRDAAVMPVFVGSAELGDARPDVEPVLGRQFGRSGWSVNAEGFAPGTYDVTAYFWSVRTKRFESARTVTVEVK